MPLRWERRSTDRWLGYTDTTLVGFVGRTVSEGGEVDDWLAWLRDGTASGNEIGRFDTAEEAIAAVDAQVRP